MQPQPYVGIDLHRRRSVIVQRSHAGETLSATRVANDDVLAFSEAVLAGGESPEVVIEATYGWYWAADFLEELGCRVHLAHPLGNNWGNRRVKNDLRDAEDLVDLLRLGRLSESWIAPNEVRELRELVRYRAKLVGLRTNLKLQVYSVLAKEGVAVSLTDVFGVAGSKFLDQVKLAPAYATKVESLRELVRTFDDQVESFDTEIRSQLAGHAGYKAIQAIPRLGPITAAIFVAEIGDVSRFSKPAQLCCWAGLTPRHKESDTTVQRYAISKQGSRLVRWAAIEVATRPPARASKLRADFERIAVAHGNTPGARKIARVAVARKIITLVFYGLRDGTIRSRAIEEAA